MVQPSDTITVSLDDIIITAENITCIDGHLLIKPNKQQREHASNGFSVLKDLMLPRLSVDRQQGKVETMGMEATLCINDVECDSKDLRMLRPRSIEKIEYHDAPTGKYAKDKIAITFIIRPYQYSGHIQVDGLQTLGVRQTKSNVV